MKVLIPVDASEAALAPIQYITSLSRSGIQVEALVLNVQPRFHSHLAQFASRTALNAFRAERSAGAMARAIEALSLAGISFRALSEVGKPAETIAATADRERVDEIMIGTGRHPAWLRWVNPSIAQSVTALTDIPVAVFARGHAGVLERFAFPAGVAGLAVLLIAGD